MPQVAAFIAGAIGATAPAIGSVAFGSYVAGAGFATFVSTSFVGRLLATVAVSALSRALADKPDAGAQAGIRSDHTMTGATTPESFILGRYATEGQLVAPPMSHGQDGSTPNAYLTYVIDLGNIPGQTLELVYVDGKPAPIGTTPHADYGLPLGDVFADHGWVKYYDGTQVAADPMLIDKYGSDPDRPWTAEMVGNGTCYAIMTFRLKRDLYSSFPRVRFVLGGIPLYDPRKDDTAGGTGPHRWGMPATYESSLNPMVQSYNICRGISLPGGDVWGGDFQASDLPLSNWFAAMNRCDVLVDADGDQVPSFQTGFEVFVGDEPADVLEELAKGCAGRFSEIGGVWKVRVGGPGLPAFFFTDEDINLRETQSFEPFSSINETYNAVHASYPDPESLWNTNDAPPRYFEDFEAEDGGRRLVADLSFPAVPDNAQVQRLMQAYILEERRMRRHNLTLCPDAIPLEPLDSVGWSSDRNGYDAKVFEVVQMIDPLIKSKPQLSLRELDSSDYIWEPGDFIPSTVPSVVVAPPAPYVVSFWNVTASSVAGQDGTPRQPALTIEWSGVGNDDVDGLSYQVRLEATGDVVADGSALIGGAGAVRISSSILPSTTYEVRVRFVPSSRRSALWSEWREVTSLDIRISPDLLDDAVWDAIEEAATADVEAIVNVALAPTEASILTAMEGLELRSLDQLQGDLIAHQVGQQARRELAYVAQDVRAEISADRVASAAISTALGARIDDAEATLLDEVTVRASETEALSIAITATQAQLTDAEGDLAAVATAVDAVTSRVTQNEDDIEAVSQAVTSTQAALDVAEGDIAAQASTLSQHTSRLNTAEGQITAQAQSLNSVSTTVGQHTAAIDEVATSIDGLHAEYVLRVAAGNVVGGMIIGADAGDSGATTVNVTFAATAFRIAAPGGAQAAAPFAVYTSPRTIDGINFPAGVYMENAYIGRAAIGRGQITDVLQSDNYAEAANGRPTAGLKLNFATGEVKAAGLILSRSMVLAQGTLSVSGTFGNGARWAWVNTGIRVGANDVWQANRVALVAFAAVTNGAIGGGALDPNNTFWSVDAKIQPGARWNGFGGANPAPAALWSRDPATLVNPWWATATDQRLYLALSIEAMGDVTFQNPVIAWKVFEVT